MKKIETCLSPMLLPVYALNQKIAVVVDVFRATSTIAAGLHAGIAAILPVATIAEAQAHQAQGYLAAAERNGQTVAGFDLGNSPLAFLSENLRQKTIVLTTTNGTKCLNECLGAQEIICGSFVNLQACVDYLHQKNCGVIIVCAGWKDSPSLEDTLFAGALVQKMAEKNYEIADDASLMAANIYEQAKGNITEYLKNSSHYKRLQQHGTDADLVYCTSYNTAPVVPIYTQNKLITHIF